MIFLKQLIGAGFAASSGISTTNLIFHVDASSTSSYDSTQSPQPTTWTDLSGSGNDLDLTGTADGGSYRFSS